MSGQFLIFVEKCVDALARHCVRPVSFFEKIFHVTNETMPFQRYILSLALIASASTSTQAAMARRQPMTSTTKQFVKKEGLQVKPIVMYTVMGLSIGLFIYFAARNYQAQEKIKILTKNLQGKNGSEEEIKTLRKQVQTLSKQATKGGQEIASLTKNSEALKEEANTLALQAKKDLQAIASLTKEKQTLHQQVDALTAKVAKSNPALANLQKLNKKLNTLEAQTTQDRQAIENLTSDREKLKKEASKLALQAKKDRQAIDNLTKGNQTLQQQVEAFTTEAAKGNPALTSLQTNNQTLTEQVNTLQTQATQDNEKIENLTRNNEALQEKVNTLEAQATQDSQAIESLTNENQTLAQEVKALQVISQQNIEKEENDKKEDLKIDPIVEKLPLDARKAFKSLHTENIKLKNMLQEKVMGKGIESKFIKESDFTTQIYATFCQQTHDNLHKNILNELAIKYPALEVPESDSDEESDNESDDDEVKAVPNNEEELQNDFGPEKIERIGSEFLYELLMLSQQAMEEKKKKYNQFIIKLFKLKDEVKQNKNSKTKKAIEIAEGQTLILLQNEWKDCLMQRVAWQTTKEKEKEMTILSQEEITKQIYAKIFQYEKYADWLFLHKFKAQIEHYITSSCQICWIMILSMPKLAFYPPSFRYFEQLNDQHELMYDPERDNAENLLSGAEVENNAKKVYYGIPSIIQPNPFDASRYRIVGPGAFFSH